MKKRLLSLLLALALVATMIVVPAYAAEANVENTTSMTGTCPCGCGLAYSQIQWKKWEGNAATGHYYLDQDYVQDGERNVVAGEKVVLDLRGNTITTVGKTRLFLVNGYMALIDTVGGGRMCAKGDRAGDGGVVQVVDNEIPGATLELYSGTITMDIAGDKGKAGGLVYVGSGATFRMHDGLLLNGRANGYGGNIASLEDNSTLEVLGGSIIGGEANANWTSGGNIYFEGTMTLKNCKIIGGYTTGDGGNIATNGNTVTIENCVISDGIADGTSAHANGVGGNIKLQTSVKLTITDSIVRNGYAPAGGGNFYFGNGKTAKNFTRTQVYGGVSDSLGANIYNSAGAVITLTDSTIDGGVYNSTGTVTLKGSSSIGLKKGDCPHCSTPNWAEYGSAESNHWKLSADNAAFPSLFVANGQTVILDLAGFDLTAAGRAFTVAEGGKLVIIDTVGGGIVTGSGLDGETGGVIKNDGTLQIYGGKFVYKKNSAITVTSGGVVSNAGTFNLHGGILDGSAYSSISTTSFGGALYQANGAAGNLNYFTMSGGMILGGKAYDGGSVYIGYHGDVTITGGMIRNGKAYHEGGNLFFIGNTADTTYQCRISNCAILDGAVSNSGSIDGWGGNIGIARGVMTLNDSFVQGGSVSKTGGSKGGYGGNIHAGIGATLNATNTIIIDSKAATAGGNLYMSNARTKVNLTNTLVMNGTALRGGNIYANNGTLTVKGGEVSYGTATGTSGGNISSVCNVTLQKNDAGNLPRIYRGSAVTYGGNLYLKYAANIDAAHIAKGTSGTSGADVYVVNHDDTAVTFGAAVKGDIALCVDKTLFASADIYGGAINKITCKATDATFYIDGMYNNCGTLVKDETIYLTVAAVVAPDGTMQWYTSNEDAVAACSAGSYVKLFTDKALVLTKDLTVDLNGNTVAVSGDFKFYGLDSSGDDFTEPKGSVTGTAVQAYAMTETPDGNRYVAVNNDGTVTYHRLDMKITTVNIRPSADGMYYTGKWSCDDTLKGLIATYGVVASTEDMPVNDFASDAGNLWTTFAGATFESGISQNGAVITGIMKAENRTGEQNDEYGRKPVYAKAYVAFADGPSYVSGDNIHYSLYDVMKGLDSLIESNPTKYRRHTLSARNFYETWKTMGMGNWKLNKIPTPAEDDTINVLMIGNSHCYYYVEELYNLAKAAGIDMRVCNVYYSGCYLEQHYNWWMNDEANYQFYETYTDGRSGVSNATLEWCLAQYDWDVISIQTYGIQQSATMQDHFEETALYHETLLPYLKAQFPETRMLWHQTWGYQFNGGGGDYTRGNASDCKNLYEQQRDFAKLICAQYGYERVPSGEAWNNMRNDYDYNYMCVRLGNENNWGDGYHDGDIGGGQYLNACVWFEVITGQSVVGNTYVPSYKTPTISGDITQHLNVTHDGTYYTLNADFVAQLQAAAHKAVTEMNAT